MNRTRSRAATRSFAAVAAVALALLAGCAAPRLEVGLLPVPAGQVRERPLVDDADFAGLADALRQSIRYYRRLPESATFTYGDLVYTAREMEASTALFLKIVEETRGRGARRRDPREVPLLREPQRAGRGVLHRLLRAGPPRAAWRARSASRRRCTPSPPTWSRSIWRRTPTPAWSPRNCAARACAASSRGESSSPTTTATGSASAARWPAAPSRSPGWPTRSSSSSCRSRARG